MNGSMRQGAIGLLSVLAVAAGIMVLQTTDAIAVSQKTTIGVAQFKSTVEDISAPVARSMLIKALAQTSRFAIPPQKVSNKIVGVEYILDGTIKEAKPTSTGKSNALSFLRGAVADNLISVEVRVFQAGTMALVDTISAKSGDINTSKKFGAGDAAGLLGALSQSGGVGNASGNAPESPDVQKMEQRLEPLITEIASQIAARYGAGQMQSAPAAPGMDSLFGLFPNDQQQQQQPTPAPGSQKGTRR